MHRLPEAVLEAINATNVPPLPQVLLRLLQAVENESISVADLTSIVDKDPALAARVLSAANSAAFRRERSLSNIEDCLVALGTRLVRSIAVCLAVQRAFDARNHTSSVDITGFWRHSLLTAELARSIAQAVGYRRPEEAYLAGLLHDIGELVLLSALDADYGALLNKCTNAASLCELEQANFGTDHGAVGAWLIDRWNLNSTVADSVLFHHQPADSIAGAEVLARIVWLAQAATLAGVPSTTLCALANRFIGLAPERLAGLRDDAEARMRTIAAAMGISLPEGVVLGGEEDCRPRGEFLRVSSHNDGEEALRAAVGGLALLQPLQASLSTLNASVELLPSLREAASILFGIGRPAFLFLDAERTTLRGVEAGDQPEILVQAEIALAESRCLAALVATDGRPRCTFDSSAAEPGSLLDIQFARALGSEGLLCLALPAASAGGNPGVVLFGIGTAQYARLGHRMPWLLAFAKVAGGALAAWRTESTRDRNIRDATVDRFQAQARRVIHEVGNPVGIIKSYLRILDDKLKAAGHAHQELEVLREEIDRVSAIVRRLTDVPEMGPPDADLEVNRLVSELLSLYGIPLFGAAGIEVVLHLDEQGSPIAACDRDSLKQVLVNLFKNAAEAMADGGTLCVETQGGVVSGGKAWTEVVVQDSGPGLPEEAMARLFKAEAPATLGQGGRGMGLAIVGALVARMGARISCLVRQGKGTRISLLLPIDNGKADRTQ